jgi:NADPH:quinone reductase-like Zn-dependent oxidoreductase
MNCAASMSQTHAARQTMKAVQVHAFGGLDAMIYEDIPLPIPGSGQVLVRVAAAGVGPWDAWIREGKSVLAQPLPLVLGADLSGIVAAAGAEVTSFNAGDDVFGVTNARFTGAYAEYALAEATMIRRKSPRLSHVEAASMPVVASTAWQMLFNHARIGAGTLVLVLGGNGNVGGFAVQLAHNVGASVVATASADQRDDVRSLGADEVLDANAGLWERVGGQVDVVIDTIGGQAAARSFDVLRPGGILVSAVAEPDRELASHHGVRAEFMLVTVTTAGLTQLADLIQGGKLHTRVGEVLPLSDARMAHEMLAGRKHRPGKIVLVPAA